MILHRHRERRREGYLFQEAGSQLGEQASLKFTGQPSRLETHRGFSMLLSEV